MEPAGETLLISLVPSGRAQEMVLSSLGIKPPRAGVLQ